MVRGIQDAVGGEAGNRSHAQEACGLAGHPIGDAVPRIQSPIRSLLHLGGILIVVHEDTELERVFAARQKDVIRKGPDVLRMIGGKCIVEGKGRHALAGYKTSVESPREIRPNAIGIGCGETCAARGVCRIDHVEIGIESRVAIDSRVTDEIGATERQSPRVQQCRRENMILTEGDVLIPAQAERKELRIPVSRISGAQVVVRGDEARVVQRVAREKRVRRRKGMVHPNLAVVVPHTR